MRILVDSSVWINHFRQGNPLLQRFLEADYVITHPLIILELACGTPPKPRNQILDNLQQLRSCAVAQTDEVLSFIDQNKLYGSGCGAVDLSLLVSVLLDEISLLWTEDRRLYALAQRFGIAYQP